PGTVTSPDGAGDPTGRCAVLERPDYERPGVHASPNGPSSTPDPGEGFEKTVAGGEATPGVSSAALGPISGHGAESLWCLRSLDGEGRNSGSLATDPSGRFDQKIPLFCGKQILNLGWKGAAGDYYVVTYHVDRKDCDKGGL